MVVRAFSFFALCTAVVAALFAPHQQAVEAAPPNNPIQHVVVIYQENHSFNEVLGWYCLEGAPCNASDTGRLHTGQQITLRKAPDIVPGLKHTIKAQRISMAGGKMNGFSKIHGCTIHRDYACYQMYRPAQIPNLAALAREFVVSDHTFETDVVSSWGSHIEIAAAQLDGFTGDNPVATEEHPNGPGWGCNSYRDAPWRKTPTSRIIWVPSCIPKKDGSGPYRESPVKYVPTIMDRLLATGHTWRIYRPGHTKKDPRLPYGWSICPTFAECLLTKQAMNVKPDTQIIDDAQAGRLANFSIVIPQGRNSQHNGWSMLEGDNWVADVVGAIMDGPQWNSTAIFVTYDDCGCFYDNLRPPKGLGIRVPMVIVSPYAKAGFVDPNVAELMSILAFTEETFGLKPLANSDANAYDFAASFDFNQQPRAGIELERHPLPEWEREWLRTHAPARDEDET